MTRPDKSKDEEPVVITDKRKVDRDGGSSAAAAPAGAESASTETEPDENAKLLAERTADLQRVQAEYANYRRRSDRDRLAAGEVAEGKLLSTLLPIMDDLARANEHGDLTGAFGAVAEKLQRTLTMAGLVEFGFEGDPFDPTIHEAVMHDESADVDVPTCTKVLRKGYTFKERMLRPAMVGVSDPASLATSTPDLPENPTGGTDQQASNDTAPQQDETND